MILLFILEYFHLYHLYFITYILALLFKFFYWHADKSFDAFVHKFSFPGKVLSALVYLAENLLLSSTLILLLSEDFLDSYIHLGLKTCSLMPIPSPV